MLSLNQFRMLLRRALRRPTRTIPYSIAAGMLVLPLIQRLCGLSWDEAVTAIAVPLFIIYLFARVVIRPPSHEEQIELEAQKRRDSRSIPADIAAAIILGIALSAVGLLSLASTLAYWLIGLPFTDALLKFDWMVGRFAIYTVAYVGVSLCWRWCMPLIRYELHSLVATLFALVAFPIGTTRRGVSSGAATHL
jgi:Na+/glutamate symporter